MQAAARPQSGNRVEAMDGTETDAASGAIAAPPPDADEHGANAESLEGVEDDNQDNNPDDQDDGSASRHISGDTGVSSSLCVAHRSPQPIHLSTCHCSFES